jgi:MFS transporter, UMF1 family
MNDRRQIFGWAMYDWANSAFATTILTAVFPMYFGSVVVPEGGMSIFGVNISAISLLGFASSFYALMLFITAPVFGAIADFSASRKKFLMFFCYLGSIFSVLLYFCDAGEVWLTLLFFVLAQVGFVGGNIFYDSFLPRIASEDKLDRVSGIGFAYGYLGGGIQFALSLGLIAGHEALGITTVQAAKLSMAMAGLWWGGFALVTFRLLHEAPAEEKLPGAPRGLARLGAYCSTGITRTIGTARKVRRFKHLLLFLVAFMIYNDAVQTVIKMASIYGLEEIKLSQTSIMITLLIIQFVAFFGALLFGWIAEHTDARRALLLTIILWTGVVIYGYFMTNAVQFFILGIVVGITMGGSQALSRSLYGAMIPVNASAEFYGFYSVFSKFSAIWGPAVFGVMDMVTGSARNGIISLSVFFVVGFVLLAFVDVAKAKEARNTALF